MRTLPNLLATLVSCVFVLTAFVSPAAAQDQAWGTIDFMVKSCPGSPTGVVEAFDPACVPATATFSLYLRGDNSAEFQQVIVDPTTGHSEMLLAPGSYEVVEEGTQTHFDVEITADKTTRIDYALGSPAWARVYVGNYACSQIESAYWMELNAGPTEDLGCEVQTGDISFYLVGDGTNTYKLITTQPGSENFVDLAPGTYEVVHEATQIKATFDIPANDFTAISFVMPSQSQSGITPTAVPATVVPTVATVKSLPATGVGASSDMAAMMASLLVGSGLLLASAVRLRSR